MKKDNKSHPFSRTSQGPSGRLLLHTYIWGSDLVSFLVKWEQLTIFKSIALFEMFAYW